MSTGNRKVGVLGSDAVKLLPVSSHRRIRSWVAFDPPLRDRAAGAACMRRVSCRECSVVLGWTDDPVEAILIAVRHRLRVRRGARSRRFTVSAASR